MTNQEAQDTKARLLTELREYLTAAAHPFLDVDERLRAYALDCVREDEDRANLYELLALRKALRMGLAYPVDGDKVLDVLYAYEGEWADGRHVQGGLQFSGLRGKEYYRLTPLQVFELAVPFGFMRAADDWRRVTTEAVYFIPRKSSKTTLAAFMQAWFFLCEDANNEGYCIANSQDQAKILFKLTSDLIRQIDPKERRIRFTNTELNWKPGQARDCKVAALTAGGKTKDGLFAGLVCADEYGSAGYVKGKSDMANLLQVVEGSMGARREPLTVITTTAGRVSQGPFQIKLDGVKASLLDEMTVPLGEPTRLPNDWQFALLCCPDQWEEDDDHLRQPYVWHKVNRHIGVTVQPDYYESEWRKMMLDEEKKKEQITKLFNVFQSSRTKKWITADQIARLQGTRRVDDLNPKDGWACLVGMDFSRGDDFCATSYLCYNPKAKRFFADCDAWITARTLTSHTNHLLYEGWARQGWLRVFEGDVIREQALTERVAELADHVRLIRFGYDPYDAQVFVNYLKAWLKTRGVAADALVRPVKQTWGQFNSACQFFERLVSLQAVEFSPSPLLPWCFGNAVLEEDKYENVKPVKATANGKIDPVICLLEGVIMLEEAGLTI